MPWVLEEKDGVILRVNATYKEVDDSSNNSKKALELVFQEAVVSDVRISELTETLLAPAILPRSELNQRALLFLRDFEVRFPLFGRAARAMGGSDENGVSGAAVGRYEFSYCDEDVLIGKATGSQGIFIFTKENSFPSLILESSLLITEASSVCLESFALGKPVIVVQSNTGLTYDPIPDDIPQELFRRSHDDDSLSEAIIHFANLNLAQRASLVNFGKDIKSKYFEPISTSGIDLFLNH